MIQTAWFHHFLSKANWKKNIGKHFEDRQKIVRTNRVEHMRTNMKFGFPIENDEFRYANRTHEYIAQRENILEF